MDDPDPNLIARITGLSRFSSLSTESIAAVTLLVAAAFAIQLAGLDAQQILRYERQPILDGEVWRLLTGHLVHLGWAHLLLNVAALVFLLFGLGACPPHLSANLIVIAFAVSSGLLIFEPALEWYVGLSGVLHGIAVLVALRLWTADRLIAAALFAGTAAKIVWEQTTGADADLVRQIGGEVIIDAHLYGFLAAIACTLSTVLLARHRHRAGSADNADNRL
ncbi:rhombosortase [Proteobacteria bacterium 005FR1]|nr:rhombosortase [Proteobacteria bacterium 005FR1]